MGPDWDVRPISSSVAESTESMLNVAQSRLPLTPPSHSRVIRLPLVTTEVVSPNALVSLIRSGSQGQRVGSPPAKFIF